MKLPPFDPAAPAIRTKVLYLLNREEFTALVRHWYARPDFAGPDETFVGSWRITGQIADSDQATLDAYQAGTRLTPPAPYLLLAGLVSLNAIPAGAYQVDLTR